MLIRKNALLTLFLLLLILFFAFTLSGCPMQRERADTPRPPAQNKTAAAEQISAVATQVEGVKNAYAVMLGTNTALVGIELEKKNLPRNEMLKMEDTAAKKIIAKVNVVQTVYVTASNQVIPRIKNIAQKVAQGQPVEKFQKDTNNIIRDLNETTR